MNYYSKVIKSLSEMEAEHCIELDAVLQNISLVAAQYPPPPTVVDSWRTIWL